MLVNILITLLAVISKLEILREKLFYNVNLVLLHPVFPVRSQCTLLSQSG